MSVSGYLPNRLEFNNHLSEAGLENIDERKVKPALKKIVRIFDSEVGSNLQTADKIF